jgi:hypothetical protein
LALRAAVGKSPRRWGGWHIITPQMMQIDTLMHQSRYRRCLLWAGQVVVAAAVVAAAVAVAVAAVVAAAVVAAVVAVAVVAVVLQQSMELSLL